MIYPTTLTLAHGVQSRIAKVFPSHFESVDGDPGGQPRGLVGLLAHPLTQTIEVHVRMLSRAGIPLFEGHTRLEAGQCDIIVKALRPIGLEGYAHRPPAERAEVESRMWSRGIRAAVTVSIVEDSLTDA